MSRILMVVDADTRSDAKADPEDSPRRDFAALAALTGADVLDRTAVDGDRLARIVRAALGDGAARAWLGFRRRRAYSVIVTDGEGTGIPLALLLKLARDAATTHVTIGHRLSSGKKRPFFRWLKVQSHMHRIAVHSTHQRDLAVRELGIEPSRVVLVPYQVDADFWRPQTGTGRRLICSAGLEHRDYPTLFRAVEHLDAEVAIGAASPYSRQRNSARDAVPPSNVRISAFGYRALRELYAQAAVVVVPLYDVDFQAGVTTILEAMAMAKPVVVTATRGQADVVSDRRSLDRHSRVGYYRTNLLQRLADEAGITLEANGFYVPPGEPAVLERALRYLLDHPEERVRLGAAGRRAVERLLTVDHFAERMRTLIEDAAGTSRGAPAPVAAAGPSPVRS